LAGVVETAARPNTPAIAATFKNRFIYRLLE